MKHKAKVFLHNHKRVAFVVRHTDHVAHISYFGAAFVGLHELYGYAAGIMLVVFVVNLVMGNSEA